MTFRLPAPALLLQTGGIILGLLILAFSPPASGRLLLVPLTRAAAADLVPRALRSGSLLVGRGPLPRSYVVVGNRDRVAAATAGLSIVTIAAPPAGCGGQPA